MKVTMTVDEVKNLLPFSGEFELEITGLMPSAQVGVTIDKDLFLSLARDIKDALFQGKGPYVDHCWSRGYNKIPAIKHLRDAIKQSGGYMGLADAKHFVEAIAELVK